MGRGRRLAFAKSHLQPLPYLICNRPDDFGRIRVSGDHNHQDESYAATARLPWLRPEVTRFGAAGAELGETTSSADAETSKS
jgi:hypothetical protein